MRRGYRSAQLFFFALPIFIAACGGGGETGGVQPPPPTPDFSINVSASSVSVTQGSTSAPINVSITPQNSFAGSVQVSITGLPAGVASNPTSPFPVTAGQSVEVLFGAASNAQTGQFNLTAQGTSGTLSHSESLSLAIQAMPPSNLSRTRFVESDFVTAVDTPSGQPHRRHIVYDATNQRFYVANLAMNRVEVFSAGTPALQTFIAAPGASSVDLSTDGSTLWVGTDLEQILAIDTTALQVKARYPITGVTPIPNVVFIRPTEALALAGGELLVRLRQPGGTQALLALWDPPTNAFTNLTSFAPAVFQNGVGVLARSGDHTCVLAAANDTSGELAVFNSSGALIAGPAAPLAGTVTSVAANSNGSSFAVAVSAGAASQVLLLNANLGMIASYNSTRPAGLLFSADGQSLYVDEPYGNSSVVSVLSTSTMQKIGQVPDIPIQGVPTTIEELGSAAYLVGLNNRGVAFLDASQPTSLPQTAPAVSTAPSAQPAEGPAAGGTAISLLGTNFSANAQIAFGSGSPINATAASATQLQFSSPASAIPGPMNLTAYFPNGWLAVATSSFSYGPVVLRVLPNAGKSQGGDTVTVLGYGFGSAAGSVTVNIGGNAASVQSVQALPAFANTLGLDSTYPFALECITLTTPAGNPGKADLTIQSPAGSTTTAKAFQYLTSSQIYPNPPLYKFVLYDQSRQHLYLSATDHIDVFDLNAQAFLSAIEPPPNGPPPDADLRGVALTPDASQLIVADFGAQNVYLVNPDGAAYNGTVVAVGGVAGYSSSGPARVAATSAQTVFVGLTGQGSATGSCNGCLGQLNLLASPPAFQPAPEPEVSSLTGTPLLQADAVGDVAYLAYDTSPGGPVALWNAATPDAFAVSTANDTATDLVTSGDGTIFAMRAANTTEIRGANLSLFSTPATPEWESIPNRVAVPGIAIHPSGALTYEPFLTGAPPAAPPATGIQGGVDIRDAHSGQLRLRVYMPEAFAMLNTDVDGAHGVFLTTDENGQRLFVLTTSGLSIVQLANVPLGIGTLSPSSGSAAGGTVVTLRGSGFQSGITATLGGKAASVSRTDMNTLILTTPALAAGPQQLVLTNPDGESVALDSAFSAQ
ncbi:MAG TPA: IPT/TIG domain-containing protein [Candidatus Sulfotelmatobacter sp.]|nr:IPT/TIG domain-containing protein [Candidatus Sulfotelmatobacter sp.]